MSVFSKVIAKHVIFEGHVQGVGFRYATRELAKGFDITGSVQNLPDGTVELFLMGEVREVAGFLQEITEESSIAHHIKNTTSRDTPLWEMGKGFRIL